MGGQGRVTRLEQLESIKIVLILWLHDSISGFIMYPLSDSQVTAVLGPTNTGKTFLAIERMLAHKSGMMGFPLRLLARENYDKVVRAKGSAAVALVTGEEKIIPANPAYWICTVEAMPLDLSVEFMAIDEIQLAGDPERGHVFTDRLLNSRGTEETLFLGSDTIRPLLRRLVPEANFLSRPRFSTLGYVAPKKISRIPPRSAVVVFSASEVYEVAETLRRQRGGAAVVLGALSPRTRNAQVEMFQSGEVDFLVATDAIGLGLNMDLDHVTFGKIKKFDGRKQRFLTVSELAQIAGRAGRHMNDGTFCTTAEVGGLNEEVVAAIEGHRFDPLESLMWRTRRLKFSSVTGLLKSLEEKPPVTTVLQRAQDGDDHRSLRVLSKDPELTALVKGPAAVRLLWDVCQVPDFRKTLTDSHTNLLSSLVRFLLSGAGCLPEDWIATQLRRLDKIEGDIDTLVARISAVRTWTFISHRGDWVQRRDYWQDKARAIEDRLSDALHEKLTSQFVDRRAAVIVRRLNSNEELQAGIRSNGEIVIESEEVGTLTCFDFKLDEAIANGDKDTIKPVLTAVRRVIGPEITRRLISMQSGEDKEFKLRANGGLYWSGHQLAQLTNGADVLNPAIQLRRFDFLEPEQKQIILNRLQAFLSNYIRMRLAPLFSVLEVEDIPQTLRGILFQLQENLGLLPRREIIQDANRFSEEDREFLRHHQISVSRHAIWLAQLMDKKAQKLKGQLWRIFHNADFDNPAVGQQIIILPEPDYPDGIYQAMGYVVLGREGGRVAVQANFLPRLEKRLSGLVGKASSTVQMQIVQFTRADDERVSMIWQPLGYRLEDTEDGKFSRLPPRKNRKPKAPKLKADQTGKTTRGRARIPQQKSPQKPMGDPLSPFAVLAVMKTG
jgi:ATP-dependent RNA helicase SUPV3L1/SUV3